MANRASTLSTLIIITSALVAGCAATVRQDEQTAVDVKEGAHAYKTPPKGARLAMPEQGAVSTKEVLTITEFPESDPLPAFEVKGLSFNNADVYEVLQKLVELPNQNIALVVNLTGAQASSLKQKVSVLNLNGKFSTILENLAQNAGFLYRFKAGVLTIEADQQFIVSLPPVPTLVEAIPPMLLSLGATDVYPDKATRLVAFRATQAAYKQVDGYLSFIRKNRSLSAQPEYSNQILSLTSQPAQAFVADQRPEVWIVKPRSRLRHVVNEFAAKAGWISLWNYKDEQTLEDKDLELDGGMRVEGDFKQAVKEIFNSLPKRAKVKVELWPENYPPTIYIMREGSAE